MGSSSTLETWQVSGQQIVNLLHRRGEYLSKNFVLFQSQQSCVVVKDVIQGLCACRHSPIRCGRNEECSIHGNSSHSFSSVTPCSPQDNSANVKELATMEGFFQERKEFGFGAK